MTLKIVKREGPSSPPTDVSKPKDPSISPTTPGAPFPLLQALSDYKEKRVQAMYSRAELASISDCSERTLQKAEKAGDLKPSGKPGRGSFYYAEDVEAFLRKSKERRKGRRKK